MMGQRVSLKMSGRAGLAPLAFLLCAALTVPAQAASLGTQQKVDGLSAGWRNGDGAVAQGHAGAVVMMYGETQPVLKCKPLNICVVRLEPGEQLTEAPTVGDQVRWSVQVRAGDIHGKQTVYVVTKPASTAEPTSMFLVTNKRSYDIELMPSVRDWTPLLSFKYPGEIEADNKARVAAMRRKAEARHRAEAKARAPHEIKVAGHGVLASKLDFNYAIRGQARFRPARIFNDGRHTYVDLPPSYAGAMPVFLQLSRTSGGKGEPVNYRVIGKRFIIDRVVQSGELTLGVGGRAETITFQKQG